MPDTRPTLREALHTQAIFMPKTDENGQPLSENVQRENKVTVHFNPESLDITFTNSVQKGRRNQPAQVSVTETTAKLSMELIFDTTRDGADVRTRTNLIGRMMDPAQQHPRRNNRNRKIPSIVIFQWGTIWFEGYIDTYKEKLDFFSSQGVPLRAVVTLSMTQQQRDFKPNTSVQTSNNTSGDLTPGTNDPAVRSGNAPVNRTGADTSVTDAVASISSMAAGNCLVARAVASANGIENMRLPEVNELVLPNLKASDGANLSLKAGGGLSVGTTSQTPAQFANLKQSVKASMGAGVSLGLESHFNAGFQMGAGISADIDAGFSAGAQASMSADVGVSADIEPGITFED